MTAQQMSRWRRQITNLKEHMMENGFSAGASQPIVYTDKECSDFEIARFGRLELREGEYTFKAGPEKQDNPALFKFPRTADMSLSSDFGKPDYVFDRHFFSKELADPVPIKVERITPKLYELEASLFEWVSQKYQTVCLLNPSFITLKAARDVDFSIWLTDMSYEAEINSQLKELRIRTAILDKEPKDVMVYAGSHDPAAKPKNFFRLQVNPYSSWADTQHVAFHETEKGVEMVYQKKTRMVSDAIIDDDKLYRYSPPTVEANFGGQQCFWLISTEPLGLPKELDDDKLPHKPRMLAEGGDYEQENGLKVSRDRNGKIVDVKGEGTYFSRRARYSALGEWSPYVSVGPVLVTRYTHKVRVSPYYSYVTTNVGQVHIYSDRDIYINLLKYPSLGGQSVQEGLAYRQDAAGTYCLAGLPKGFIKKIEVAYSLDRTKLEVDIAALEGEWILFPTPPDFQKYKWSIVLTSISWNNYLAHDSSQDTYQSKGYVETRTLIATLVSSAKLQNWGDAGIPMAKVMEKFSQPMLDSSMQAYLTHFQHVVYDNGYFSLLEQSNLRFPGEKKQLPVVDGQTVADTYRYLLDVGETIFLVGTSEFHLKVFQQWIVQLPFEARYRNNVLQVYELSANGRGIKF
jgi:hypothetical protein